MRKSNVTLQQMELFVAVVEQQSFTRAAKLLATPLSTVSRQVTALEEELGVQLLRRSTRSLAPTWHGSLFLQRCRQVLTELEEATRELREASESPTGRLRVSGPVEFGMRFFGPVMADYLRRYPSVELELMLSERRIDLIEEGFDLALRVGTLPDSNLKARKLAEVESWCCGSPSYLSAHGEPSHPRELSAHPRISTGLRNRAQPWQFRRRDKTVSVAPEARLHVNNFQLARDAALADLGLCVLPAYVVTEQVRAGRLRRILSDWALPSAPIHAVYANVKHTPRALVTFLETLGQHMARLQEA